MDKRLCSLAELSDAVPKELRIGNRGVAVVRIGEEVFAVGAVCPHWAGPLSQGQVSAARREIVCPWHRFRYSLRDGRCIAATNRPPVAAFAVRIEDGSVYADIPPKEN
ncbi:MAG: Rieske (2Fe-2S) protein [Stellaceae bacterium]